MNKLNVILLVGGKNTRLSNANNKDSNIPKSLVKINSVKDGNGLPVNFCIVGESILKILSVDSYPITPNLF